MNRLTITLSAERYRALKQVAAQRGKTMGQLIDDSLEFYGIKSHDAALELVRRARAHSGLAEPEAIELALHETRAARRSRARSRSSTPTWLPRA